MEKENKKWTEWMERTYFAREKLPGDRNAFDKIEGKGKKIEDVEDMGRKDEGGKGEEYQV